jgi:hypothetical protein
MFKARCACAVAVQDGNMSANTTKATINVRMTRDMIILRDWVSTQGLLLRRLPLSSGLRGRARERWASNVPVIAMDHH